MTSGNGEPSGSTHRETSDRDDRFASARDDGGGMKSFDASATRPRHGAGIENFFQQPAYPLAVYLTQTVKSAQWRSAGGL